MDVDLTGDASGWSLIPLPEGYRDRLIKTDIDGLSLLKSWKGSIYEIR